jgi:hypothetical protein
MRDPLSTSAALDLPFSAVPPGNAANDPGVPDPYFILRLSAYQFMTLRFKLRNIYQAGKQFISCGNLQDPNQSPIIIMAPRQDR